MSANEFPMYAHTDELERGMIEISIPFPLTDDRWLQEREGSADDWKCLLCKLMRDIARKSPKNSVKFHCAKIMYALVTVMLGTLIGGYPHYTFSPFHSSFLLIGHTRTRKHREGSTERSSSLWLMHNIQSLLTHMNSYQTRPQNPWHCAFVVMESM